VPLLPPTWTAVKLIRTGRAPTMTSTDPALADAKSNLSAGELAALTHAAKPFGLQY